jgi:hypothetical protein
VSGGTPEHAAGNTDVDIAHTLADNSGGDHR